MSYIVELLDGEITQYSEDHEPQEYVKPVFYSAKQHKRYIRVMNQIINVWRLVEEQINFLLSYDIIKSNDDTEFFYKGLYKIFFNQYRLEHSNDMKSKNKVKRIKNQILPL